MFGVCRSDTHSKKMGEGKMPVRYGYRIAQGQSAIRTPMTFCSFRGNCYIYQPLPIFRKEIAMAKVKRISPEREKQLRDESWYGYIKIVCEQNYEKKMTPSVMLIRRRCDI